MRDKILLLEDNRIDADLIRRILLRSDYKFEVKEVTLKEDFIRELGAFSPDLIISDYNLKSFNALDAIKIKNEICEDVPVIVISGTIGEEKAVHLIKEGAIDFLIKDNMNRLPQMVMRAIEQTVEKEERQRAEEALKKEKHFTDKIFDSLSGLFYVLDSDLKMKRVNKKFMGLLGYSWDEVKDTPVHHFVAEDDHQRMDEAFRRIYDKGEVSVELRLQHKNGSLIYYLLTGTQLKRVDSNYILGTGIDISNRIKAEQEIKEALNEREVLLAEIHHRVKNNLAVVSGIMQLQIFESEDEKLKEKLDVCQTRIKSIGLIHELLYQSSSFSRISFNKAIKRLVEEISLMTKTDKQIDVNVNLEKVDLNVNQAIPFTLILNELLTNVYKHAFPDQGSGRIDLTLKEKGDRVHLILKDNGVGLPEDVTIKNVSSLGFKLVEVLSKQLNADLKYESDGGSTFNLSFLKSDKKGSGSNLPAQSAEKNPL